MESDTFICILSAFSSVYFHRSPSVSACISLSLFREVFVRLNVYFLQLPPPSFLPLSPPHCHKRSLSSLSLSLKHTQFPSLSLSLSLSLIYIAMTPVSVMQAPCCEFHLSRKTSGDCYANGYVVGLVQEGEKKNGDVCILMCVGRR